jgi:uncharacterized protein YjbI with pentapeptide repeats
MPPPVAPEIQAILTVLGRRNLTHRDDRRLNLRGTTLGGVDLIQAHLSWVDLGETNLRLADLREAHLEQADLANVDLGFARLNGAHLEGANLYAARLENASFIGAHLEGASLVNVHLDWTSFWRVHLTGADLTAGYLQRLRSSSKPLQSWEGMVASLETELPLEVVDTQLPIIAFPLQHTESD